MIIDFHTHIFPDQIAKDTIAYLENKGSIKSFTKGTKASLCNSMKEAGIDYSVVLPVVTKPSQFHSVNRFAASITEKEGLISFGGIHPETKQYKAELDEIKALGLKGIKIHPDYQKSFIDEEDYLHIVDYALQLGLIVVTHAGLDFGFAPPYHCTPKRAANLIRTLQIVESGKTVPLIFAHTGGFQYFDEVEEYLVGLPVYFDLSFTIGKIKQEQFLRIIRSHGIDKVLFATDSPWDGQKKVVEQFLQLPFSEEEREHIFSQNAIKLLQGKGEP